MEILELRANRHLLVGSWVQPVTSSETAHSLQGGLRWRRWQAAHWRASMSQKDCRWAAAGCVVYTKQDKHLRHRSNQVEPTTRSEFSPFPTAPLELVNSERVEDMKKQKYNRLDRNRGGGTVPFP